MGETKFGWRKSQMFLTFLHPNFFRLFRLFPAPTNCSWGSEDDHWPAGCSNLSVSWFKTISTFGSEEPGPQLQCWQSLHTLQCLFVYFSFFMLTFPSKVQCTATVTTIFHLWFDMHRIGNLILFFCNAKHFQENNYVTSLICLLNTRQMSGSLIFFSASSDINYHKFHIAYQDSLQDDENCSTQLLIVPLWLNHLRLQIPE